MRTQVVDAVDAERLRARLVHAQRVAVVEAQRIGHRQAALRQRRAQRVDVSARHLQQFLRERAGVLGIGVDPAFEQRAPEDAGAAELAPMFDPGPGTGPEGGTDRSEEHTSELQSLMRISYAVFCLKTKKHAQHTYTEAV